VPWFTCHSRRSAKIGSTFRGIRQIHTTVATKYIRHRQAALPPQCIACAAADIVQPEYHCQVSEKQVILMQVWVTPRNLETFQTFETFQRFQDFVCHSMCVEGADTSKHLPHPPVSLSHTKQHRSRTKPANSWVFFDIIGAERKVKGTNQLLSQSDNMMTHHSQISVNQTHADTSVVYLRFNK
jgi:hypothetical protein